MPSEASARLQKMLDEVHAEARAGFGGKAAPWMRRVDQENRAVDGSHDESHHNYLSIEAEAEILDAIEAALLGDQPGHDRAAPDDSDDVSEILAQSIAAALLTDEWMRADSDQGSGDYVDYADSHLEGVQFDIEDGIRQALEAEALQSAERHNRKRDPQAPHFREMIELAIARSREEPQATE